MTVLDDARRAPPKKLTRGLAFKVFADIELSPRKSWLVAGMFGAGEMSCIYAGPGSGKSILATDMAAHVAAGWEWFSRRVQRSAVLYVAAERARLVERRLAAFRTYHKVDVLPLAVVSGCVDLRSSDAHAREIVDHAKQLREMYGLEVGLVVVDTVSRVLAGGDENSPKDMGALVGFLSQIQENTGAHVLLIHHTPQDGNARMRGHGALLGAVDTSIAIEKAGSSRTATVVKNNDGEDGACITFALESIILAIDPETGEQTTAPVVKPAIASGDIKQTQTTRLPPSAKIALRALHDAIDDHGEIPPASNYIPAGVKCVTLDHWRETAYRKGVAGSDLPRARQAAFKRALETLVAGNRVAISEPHAWPL